MSEKDLSWRFAEELVVERPDIALARTHSLEVGVEPVSKSTGAQLAFIASAIAAQSIVEIGTGLGVSGLWLLSGAPDAILTTIDYEPDYQISANAAFASAGIPANHVRLIIGRALEIMPRLNESSYDLVFIDADQREVVQYVENGLRIVRPGGTVLVAHALVGGKVADPSQRDETVAAVRTLLTELAESPAVVSALSISGDGLLQITRLNENPATERAD